MPPKAVIIGSGDFADLVYDILLRINHYHVLGFYSPLVDSSTRIKDCIPHLGDDNDIINLPKNTHVFLGLGDPDKRFSLYSSLSSLGYSFPALIDPSATVSTTSIIHDGCFVGYSSNILPYVKVGHCSIVGTSVSILHHANIGHACQIGGNSTIGANNIVESYVKIGVGTQIASGSISIHSKSILAAGSVIHKSTTEPSFLIGNPARKIPSLLS